MIAELAAAASSSSALSGRARCEDVGLAHGDHELRHARSRRPAAAARDGRREASRPSAAKHPLGIDLGAEDRGLLEHRGARDAAGPELDVDRLQAGHRLLDVVRLALGARVRDGRPPCRATDARRRAARRRSSRCGCGSRRRPRSRVWTKVVSESLVSRAKASIVASSMPSAWWTTARPLPVSGRDVKTSSHVRRVGH